MIRRFSKALLLILVLANLWFLFMLKATFYPSSMAYGLASEALPELIERWNLDDSGFEPRILYDGRGMWERVRAIPDIYSGGHRMFPMHEFVWRYNDGSRQEVIHVGISPSGKVGYTTLREDDNIAWMVELHP